MGSCEEHRSRPYIWCGLHSCEIVACLQARTWLLSRGPWWPWVAWLWQRAMGATKETPTGSTSKFELVTLWKVAQTKEGFISALRNDTVDWEMCVCFVCAGRPKRTEETSQTNSWPKAKTSSACKWAQMQEHLKLEWRATADPGRSSTTTPERTPRGDAPSSVLSKASEDWETLTLTLATRRNVTWLLNWTKNRDQQEDVHIYSTRHTPLTVQVNN